MSICRKFKTGKYSFCKNFAGFKMFDSHRFLRPPLLHRVSTVLHISKQVCLDQKLFHHTQTDLYTAQILKHTSTTACCYLLGNTKVSVAVQLNFFLLCEIIYHILYCTLYGKQKIVLFLWLDIFIAFYQSVSRLFYKFTKAKFEDSDPVFYFLQKLKMTLYL